MRGHRFQKLIAETREAIERGDTDRARELLRRCPPERDRVAAGLLFDYSSPLGRKEPPDLLLQLYERARFAKLSLIDEYAQPPEAIEGFGPGSRFEAARAAKLPGLDSNQQPSG